MNEATEKVRASTVPAPLPDDGRVALVIAHPGHELRRLLIDTALRLVERGGAVRPANYDFLLVGRPDDCALELRQQSLWLTLDEVELTRKLTAAAAYPELAAEVAAARARFGLEV